MNCQNYEYKVPHYEAYPISRSQPLRSEYSYWETIPCVLRHSEGMITFISLIVLEVSLIYFNDQILMYS